MHAEYTELMSLVLDHEALPEERRRLQEHVATCLGCAATWQQWQALDDSMRGLPLLLAPDGFAERVACRLQAQQPADNRQRLPGVWLAGLLLALVGGIMVLLIASLAAGMETPESLGKFITDCAQVFFGLTNVVRAGQVVLQGIAGLPLALGAGVCGALTAALAMCWLWLMLRHTTWLRAPLVTRSIRES